MPVWLRNFQQLVHFNEWLLKLHSTFLLHAVGAGRFDLSVVCLCEEEIRALNKRYRNVDEETDVLAFPYHEEESIAPGELPQPTREFDYNLGDILLCPSVIDKQLVGVAHQSQIQYQLPIMVTHGLCHLLGYRHDTRNQWKQMYSKELALLTSFNCTFGTNLRPLTCPEAH